MTMSLPTLPPSTAPASPARDARATAPVSSQPSALRAPPGDHPDAGDFERALRDAQGRDEMAPPPAQPPTTQVAALSAEAQRSADEARTALAAALLTPIVSVPVGTPTAQAPHIKATGFGSDDAEIEPGLTSEPAPGLQLNATLRDTAHHVEPTRPLHDALTSGTRPEPAAAGEGHTSALALKATPLREGIVSATVRGAHNEVTAPGPATGDLASWRNVLSAELNTSDASTPTLKLPASTPSQWREPLLNTLGERVQWHVQRGSEQAVIRLDPPHLGRVDIIIKQEGGLMQVHMSATHREVVQQLQGLSDQLRQDLAGRQGGEVSVLVSEQSREGDARQRGRQGSPDDQQGRPGRALSDADDTPPSLRAFSMQTEDR